MTQSEQMLTVEPRASLITIVQVVYALHAISLGIGALTAATIVGQFLFGWPSVIAVVLSYVKRDDARGTWLESHFRWQIRTFWFSVAWSAVIALVSIPLMLVLIGFAIWAVGLFALGVWAIYRIVRGWLCLNERRPIEA